MALALADIERWNSGQVREVSTALDATSTSMDGVKEGLRPTRPPAASMNSAPTYPRLDHSRCPGSGDCSHVAARQEASKVISTAADEIDGLKSFLQNVQEMARGEFDINLETGTVTPLTDDASHDDLDYITTTLKQLLASAEMIDRELAHGLNLLDGTDEPGNPPTIPDNPGPSATTDPEHSRVSLFVDYENGIVAVRQNPTTTVDGARGGADTAPPQIHVVQAPDGRMTIDYNTWDAYENPAGVAMDLTVNGRITLDPQDDGTVNLGGNTTIYPSIETYQYRDGIPPEVLQWAPANSGSDAGPATSLSRSHWIGDATLPPVQPKIPDWRWQLENAIPFAPDPFTQHTTKLTDPSDGLIPKVSEGR